MQTHGPKRVYTPQSLEFWFGKLADDWAGFFNDQNLDLGRKIYREGEIREIELGAQDAIVHRKVEKKEEYAVIEWDEKGLVVRSSSTDLDVANAIAVAGLHEIEELVADEISLLPLNGSDSGEPASNGKVSKLERPPKIQDQPVRDLVLRFNVRPKGLVFQAFWLGPGRTRVRALGNGHAAPHPANQAERGKLISLAAYARKAHFHFSQDEQGYLLDSVKEIPDFLKNIIPVWRRYFAIEMDSKVSNLQQGVRLVELEAVADRSSGGLDLRWIFKAGESMLSDEEVRQLTERHGAPTIIPNLGIVSLPNDRWESLASWKRNISEVIAEPELPAYLIFSLFSDTRWRVTLSEEVQKWKDGLMNPASLEIALPEFLRPYQRRGVEWLVHLCESACHGLLADEMGLGKTLQIISLMSARPLAEAPHLVVCPASVVPVWREEIARFFPAMRVEVLKSGHDFSVITEPCLWLASYTQLRKHRALLEPVEFGYAVLDEGQFIKNPDAKVTHACFSIRARHRIVLTGTPLENRQLDLWSIFRFLLPGLLGSRQNFEASLLQDREATMERLRVQLNPFILRRTKAEVARELPPKVEMDLLCPMTDLQKAEYARICSEGLARLGEDISVAMREKSFGFLALLTRLRQVCCDPDLLPWQKAALSESGKLNLLIEKLGELLASGHKVVVFSQFVMLLKRVRQALEANFADLPRYELTGMTVDRLKPVQEFQNTSGAAVMLLSLKAAGTGITLHAADYVFLLDPWWNPAVEEQAVDRVHRIGQTNTVFVYRMITAGTIEERIQSLKADKKALFDRLIGRMSGEVDLSQQFSSLNSLIQLAAGEVE